MPDPSEITQEGTPPRQWLKTKILSRRPEMDYTLSINEKVPAYTQY